MGEFGHTFANSGNQDETAPYESSHQHFYCLLSFDVLFQLLKNESNMVAVQIYLMPGVT